MRWWLTFAATLTEFSMVGKMHPTISFLSIILFSRTYILCFLLMTLPWGSFGSSMWCRSNYTLTHGRLFGRSGFFEISLRLFLHVNHFCFIIISGQVLPWVGCLCRINRGVFIFHLLLPRTKNLKQNTSKYLWSRTIKIIFIIWRANKISFPLDLKSYPSCHLAEVVNVNTESGSSCCFWPAFV